MKHKWNSWHLRCWKLTEGDYLCCCSLFGSQTRSTAQIKTLCASFYANFPTRYCTAPLVSINTTSTADRPGAVEHLHASQTSCPSQEQTQQGRGWRWKAAPCRCWPRLIRQKAWLKLTLGSEIAAQSSLGIFVPLRKWQKIAPLCWKRTCLRVHRTPGRALKLLRIQAEHPSTDSTLDK